MRLVALFLLAVLAGSFIPFLAMQQASALSAITFTNETTVTSQHEQFQQVYENGTSSAVFLDANSTGSYFMDSWDGSTLTSLDSTLTNSTYLVDSHAYISPVDLSRYSLLFDGSTEYAQAAANTVYDITTQDFWMAGMFKRTSDSGTFETIIEKQGGMPSNPGYGVTIDSADRFEVQIGAGTTRIGIDTFPVSTSIGVWYAWGASFDRDALLTIYLYNMDTGVLTTATLDISGQAGSLTSTQTFTVGRRSGSSTLFFPGHMDNLIPPQIGETLTEAQFTEFATTGAINGVSFVSWYDMNDGMGTTLNDENGSNDLTLFNAPTWSSDVASASTSRPTIYVTGRDSDNSTNGYGKWNLADLSEVDDEYFSSDLAPLDIAQSTDNLYTAAINGTDYGTLFDVSLTRSFGSYTETSIHTGDVTTPVGVMFMDVTSGATERTIGSGVTYKAVGEKAETASSELIGNTVTFAVLNLDKTGSPTGNADIGTLDDSGNILDTCATLDVSTLTTSAAYYTFICEDNITFVEDTVFGIRYTGGDASNHISLFVNIADPFDGTDSVEWRRTTAGSTSVFTGGDGNMKLAYSNAKVIVYDGSPDTRYYFFESDDELRAVKRTASTSLIATAMSHTGGEPFSLIQLTDRIIIQTATDTYQLLTSTDAITQLHPNSFNTRYPQTFEIAPAARTFNSDAVMMSNATYAAFLTPNTGATARTGVLIDDVNTGGSGTIEAYDPTKFYYLSENDLTAEATSASDTSWEIEDIGAREQVEIEAYTESLGIDLDLNTTAILAADVITLSCDNGNYLINLEMFAVGSDADCNLWRILADSGDSAGRELPYVVSVEAVHASPYTTYGFELETTNPIIYALESEYDSKTVDTADFDSGGQAQQRYLFGQCYSITVTDVNTGEVALAGTACANDFTTKTISLSGVTIPDPLVHPSWNYIVERDTTNPANNIISGNVSSTTTPFNATIYVADHFIGAYKTFEQTLNYTNVNLANFTINGITENQTLYFSVFDGDGDPALNFQSQGNFLNLDMSFLDVFGEFFGIPLMGLFVIIFAGIFTKSNAYFGVFATAAVVGVMSVIGLLDIASNMWTLILIVAALGMFGARRFL